MRDQDGCPECEKRVGRVGEDQREGRRILVYWHTDLPWYQEYCVEYPDGTTEHHQEGRGTADVRI